MGSDGFGTVGGWLMACQVFFTLIFMGEYFLRLYICPEDPRFLDTDGTGAAKYTGENWHKWANYPRFCYATDFAGVVDLLSWLPYFVACGTTWDGNANIFLRTLQLVSLMKIDRSLPSFTLLDNVFSREHTGRLLMCTVVLALVIWIMCSAVLYIVEYHNANMHGGFDTMPLSLFYTMIFLGGEWAKADLSEPLGEMVGAFIAILGIGIVGIPISIFFDGYQEVASEYLQSKGLYDGALDDDDDDDVTDEK